MLGVRVIPCLDVKDGRVVKGVNFVDLRDAGDPVEQARAYNDAGADELMFLDISASSEGRGTLLDVVRRTADACFMPLSVGGGVRQVEDVRALLLAGADKASMNTAAVEDPDLISLGRSFEAIAPLLWLKAGGVGDILQSVVQPWASTPAARYAVLFETDEWREFVNHVAKRTDLNHVFVVTDSEATFQQVTSELPRSLECTQLYEDYLHNFQINTRGRR